MTRINHPLNTGKSLVGMLRFKDASDDARTKDAGQEQMGEELSGAITKMNDFIKGYEDDARVIKELGDKVEKAGEADSETKAKLKEFGDSMAEKFAGLQAMEQGIEHLKQELEKPIYKGGQELVDSDRKAAVELQKAAFIRKGGDLNDFREDPDNFVVAADYRSAVQKLMKVGLETRASVIRSFTDAEQKAFEASSLDSAMFSPQMLGAELDCNLECWPLLDLYMQANVSKSTFMYPHVESYGDIGMYSCDATCGADGGPEGNITWKQNRTYDFRGQFCLQRDTLAESNYDILGFMFRSADRSHRIARNQATITGDGVNQPRGWFNSGVFTRLNTANSQPTAPEVRQFLSSFPVEHGNALPVMHQNFFGWLMALHDSTGRFLFGDGHLAMNPDDLRDMVRLSNCLPDPTNGNTRGNTASPFVTGDFLMATAAWEKAYASVSQRPLSMEQFEGGSTKWCVSYQFGAKDGGFVHCANAGRTLHAG